MCQQEKQKLRMALKQLVICVSWVAITRAGCLQLTEHICHMHLTCKVEMHLSYELEQAALSD